MLQKILFVPFAPFLTGTADCSALPGSCVDRLMFLVMIEASWDEPICQRVTGQNGLLQSVDLGIKYPTTNNTSCPRN